MALREVTGTGNVSSGPATLYSVILTGTDGTAIVKPEVKDGSGGAVLLTLQAQPRTSSPQWKSAQGVHFDNQIHATLSGTGPGAVASFEYR